MFRNRRQANVVPAGPIAQVRGVKLPEAPALGLNMVAGLELGQQKSRQQVGGQVAGAHVNPGIFVGLTPEHLASVRAFSLRISARAT